VQEALLRLSPVEEESVKPEEALACLGPGLLWWKRGAQGEGVPSWALPIHR
jgi:hypothetical protein